MSTAFTRLTRNELGEWFFFLSPSFFLSLVLPFFPFPVFSSFSRGGGRGLPISSFFLSQFWLFFSSTYLTHIICLQPTQGLLGTSFKSSGIYELIREGNTFPDGYFLQCEIVSIIYSQYMFSCHLAIPLYPMKKIRCILFEKYIFAEKRTQFRKSIGILLFFFWTGNYLRKWKKKQLRPKSWNLI